MDGLIFGILRQLPGVLEIKTTTTNADSFFRLNFNVYINVDNRERARARVKNQRRPISLEEKQKKIIAAVRKRGNISRQQGENERQRKKSEQVEHVHFLRKTCNWEVSGSFTFYSFKTTAKKCTKKRAKLFFANQKKVCCRCKVFFLANQTYRFFLVVFVYILFSKSWI